MKQWMVKYSRRVVAAVVGVTLLLLGLAMLVLPGPGLLTMFGGLAVLSVEFAWARRFLRRVKKHSKDAWQRYGGQPSKKQD